MRPGDVNYDDFWDRLGDFIRRKHMEPLFVEATKSAEEYAHIYEEVRQGLDPQTDDDLLMYMASCEEFCMVYAFAAYEMGREEGPRNPPLRDWWEDPNFWNEIQQKFQEEGGLDKKDLEMMQRATQHLEKRQARESEGK